MAYSLGKDDWALGQQPQHERLNLCRDTDGAAACRGFKGAVRAGGWRAVTVRAIVVMMGVTLRLSLLEEMVYLVRYGVEQKEQKRRNAKSCDAAGGRRSRALEDVIHVKATGPDSIPRHLQ